MRFKSLAAGAALGVLAAVSTGGYAASETKNLAPIEAAVAGSWRPADEKARDVYRHPVDSLAFWGLKPGMTILEVQPGGGWWTNILAPYARANKGEFYAAGAGNNYAQKFSDAAVYGKVNVIGFGKDAPPLPANKFDFILSAREIHNWIPNGTLDKDLANIYAATKPGGIFAIEEHRAKPTQDPATYNGYVPEAYMIQQVEKAGFKLAAKSEINANPKDDTNHPFGVWTLPPVRKSSDNGKPVDPSFDRAKYDAIGESDRMTLRFVKPKK